jgi:hypothetical protein
MPTFPRYFSFADVVMLKIPQLRPSTAMLKQLKFTHQKTTPRSSKSFPANIHHKKWWTPLWSGLLVEPTGKHYKKMGPAVWLFLYFLTYANRTTGKLFRKRSTIARDLGLSIRTINRWLHILKQNGYIETRQAERSLTISITKWKPITK